MVNIKNAFLIVIIAVIFSGCMALNKTNPTDPSGTNYIGMHYLGVIGEFSKLDDFEVNGTIIWCVDSQNKKIYKYDIGGNLDYTLSDPRLVAPTGICSDGTSLYVTDNKIIKYNASYVSNVAEVQLPDYSSTYNFIKCAASNSYLYAATGTTVIAFDIAANSITTHSIDGFLSISDIKYNSNTNEVAIADSGTNTIKIYSSSLVYQRSIVFTEAIKGFGIKGNYLYVPTATGIHQYYYDTGVIIKTFADFGEGAGKITAPGSCDIYGDYVLVGVGNTIKYFGP